MELEKKGARAKQGTNRYSKGEHLTLKDFNLSAKESMQAQRLAKMPADDFERSMNALIEGPSLKEARVVIDTLPV